MLGEYLPYVLKVRLPVAASTASGDAAESISASAWVDKESMSLMGFPDAINKHGEGLAPFPT